MVLRPQRVLYVSEFPTALGGERALVVLIEGLDRARFEPVVLGMPGGGFHLLAQRAGAAFHGLPEDWRSGTSEDRAARLLAAIPPLAPDLVHANSLIVSTHLGRIAAALGVPCVGHVRDIMKVSRARVDALNALPVLLAASEATRGNLVGLGAAPERVRVVYDGIDAETDWDPERIAPGALRAELGLPGDALVAGIIGQICMRKDQPLFLAAAARVAPDFPALHVAIIGERYADKAESRGFERDCHVAAAPLGARAHFLGSRSDVPRLLRDFDVLVNCSRQEPCGRTILEAMALERAVLATDVGGSAELVEHGCSGMLVPAGDGDALAGALRTLLQQPDLRARLGRAARERARRRFTVAQYVEEVQRVYEQLLPRAACHG